MSYAGTNNADAFDQFVRGEALSFLLENIVGWLEAWLDPARIHIEYIPGNPLCTFGPSPHLVSDYLSGTEDGSVDLGFPQNR